MNSKVMYILNGTKNEQVRDLISPIPNDVCPNHVSCRSSSYIHFIPHSVAGLYQLYLLHPHRAGIRHTHARARTPAVRWYANSTRSKHSQPTVVACSFPLALIMHGVGMHIDMSLFQYAYCSTFARRRRGPRFSIWQDVTAREHAALAWGLALIALILAKH